MKQDPEIARIRGVVSMEDTDLADPPRDRSSSLVVIFCIRKEILHICKVSAGYIPKPNQRGSTVCAILSLFHVHAPMASIRALWLVAEGNN